MNRKMGQWEVDYGVTTLALKAVIALSSVMMCDFKTSYLCVVPER